MELKPGYKQTEVGVIPEDWQVKALHSIAKIQSGIAKNSNISVNNPILVHYLRVANVQDGFLDLTDMSKIEVSRNDLKRYEVLPGDVLMNEGGDLDKLGRGSIWHGEFNPCVHQNHVFVVRSRSCISPEYLNTWTSGASARRYFLVAGKQTTNLATINKTALGQLSIALPSSPEQKAIATALSDIDNLLGVLDRLISKKQNLKQAAMQELLTSKKRLPGFSGEWEEKKFGEQLDIIAGFGFSKSQYTNNGIKLLRIDNISHGKICWESIAFLPYQYKEKFSNFIIHENDILVALNRPITQGKLKIAILNRSDSPCILYQRVGKIVFLTQSNDKMFMFYLLSVYIKNFVLDNSVGSDQPFISTVKLKQITIILPTLSEQKAIANVLSDMDTEITALKKRRDKTLNIKQAMMQELLTGKTRLITPGGIN